MQNHFYRLIDFIALNDTIASFCASVLMGHIRENTGEIVKASGLHQYVTLGEKIKTLSQDNDIIPLEIIQISSNEVIAMPFFDALSISTKSIVFKNFRIADCNPDINNIPQGISVHDSWIGRILDPLCRPIDGRGEIQHGLYARKLKSNPPIAAQRARLGPHIDTGVRAINTFLTCRTGQRLGVFAGAGVGKSTLLAMIARFTVCDVVVVALVGERGREVTEFVEDELGTEGASRSIVVVATSDQSPLMRREAVYTATTIAEHFRDEGKHVLLIMDSVTRFCTALREIALAMGEPPATRGFPQSVFSELPKVLERAGPGLKTREKPGRITGIYTVLVDGDDLNEPISDSVRGIIDGHIILDRNIAVRGRYPAIDILKSLSRCADACLSPAESQSLSRARKILVEYYDLIELLKIGAYRKGNSAREDNIIITAQKIEGFLKQDRNIRSNFETDFQELDAILSIIPESEI